MSAMDDLPAEDQADYALWSAECDRQIASELERRGYQSIREYMEDPHKGNDQD